MKLPHLPAGTLPTTQNFEWLQIYLTEREKSVAMAYRSAALNLPHNTLVRVKVDKATYDPNNLFDLTNGYYVVPSTGVYLVSGEIFVAIGLTTYIVQCAIYVNEVQKIVGSRPDGKDEFGSAIGSAASGLVAVNEGQHIELWGYQKNGGAVEKALEIVESTNYLHVVRVA